MRFLVTMTVTKEYTVEDPANEGYGSPDADEMAAQDESLFKDEPWLVIDGCDTVDVKVEVKSA